MYPQNIKEVSPLRSFKITNPYASVDWDSWHHYKTNLHTHSTASDAQVDFSDMIKAYYDAGFDILAMTDHGVVNRGWNKKPQRIPVLSVSSIIKKPTWLTDEEYEAILDGTYHDRGHGMTDLRYGIEINTAVLTKAHVNGFFTEYGQGMVGHENDFEGPIKGVDQSGGLSVINHPGDWLESYVDAGHARDRKNVEFFADLLLRYPSCLGIEAFNRIDSVTRADRILWDELLSFVIPRGRNVWGFSNGDSHVLSDIDTSFMDFVLPDREESTVRRGMENGTFFSIGRRARYELGEDFVGEGEYPTVTRITADEKAQRITLEGKSFERVQWVSNGKVIAEGESLDLTAVSQNLGCYVRAQLLGTGGICLTQAFVLDDGDMQPPESRRLTPALQKLERTEYKLKSTRTYVIVQEIERERAYRKRKKQAKK